MRILAKKLYTPLQVIEDVCITIEGEKIVGIEKTQQKVDKAFPIVAPGLVDTHTHGAVGIDAMQIDKEGLEKLSLFYASRGVTSFLLATVSDTFEKIVHVCETVNEFKEKLPAAKLRGLYIEGPYLNPSKKGAHKEQYLKKPDIKELQKLVDNYKEIVKVFTIAPELEGSIEAIKFLAKNNVVVSIGHTEADYQTTVDAVNAGATRATHLFNAMRSFSHREPGIVGAVLTDERVFCEIICDLVHVHPIVIEIALKSKGFQKVVLVSDSMSATGLEDGEYLLGDLEVVVKNKVARLKNSDTLAGSTLTLDQAIKNLVLNLNLDLKSALTMATLNACLASNLRCGTIQVGMPADLVCFDEELNVVATFVDGKLVYSA
ncbi:N-acetylglucosamine-6-phosphate deacetylase [Pseudothermotoga thermarum]|uniref:N-acetylglucosamine-6-phosphate deacetylase n=1 Tax=Pseudothermotoga thermarum DSM 5069 TaxID=688269 RepID=F7YWM3_9THEM|nr:N-acetylglucosamine-6-phosphate deacetylase [Pseudothermotoga thermarum]AEH52008.1 N-acetylglucosamine-6-phosphate deacetylase [Pseudothermotoga thermarum DSM 5069]